MRSETPADRPDAPTPTASARPLASTSSITTALSVGWLLAELRTELGGDGLERLPTGSLIEETVPGSSGSLLAAVPSATVRIRQIQAKLARLQDDLDQARVPKDDSEALTRLARLATAADVAGQATPARSSSRAALASLVEDVTQDVLANLTAASTRLGRAFGLGFDLAKTCQLAPDAQRDTFIGLFGTRVVDVQEALADLASSLPEHASRGVSLSLAQWQHWAMNPTLSKRPVVWPQEGVADALARQGQVWRAILSGEKLGTDMLGTQDYFDALDVFAEKRRRWAWLLVPLFLIGAVSVYLLIASGGA